MLNIPEHRLSVVDRRLWLRARGDLQISEVHFAGQSTYVLKDPVTLEMVHLTAQEYDLFDRLHQPTTLSRLQRRFERQFPGESLSIDALNEYLQRLYDLGLLVSGRRGQGEQLYDRGLRRRRSETLQAMVRLLAIRFPGFDATRLLDWLYPKVGWIFSRPVGIACMVVLLVALAIVGGHWNEVVRRLQALGPLAAAGHLVLWIATIGIVKLLHELAHALVCKHVGGRCHEIGVMLLALAPTLYTDVSDVWRIPNKWHRMAVSAAGMGLELVLAAVATIVWWNAQPGLLASWCLSIVVVCSVGTLLVNLNPLLRYDGYYILSDLLEIPNLSTRARGLLSNRLKGWLLAEPVQEDPWLGPAKRPALLFYAVASRLYLAGLLVGIYLVLRHLAGPYHLENLVHTLAVLVVAGFLVPPAVSNLRWLSHPVVRSRIRRARAAVLAVVVAGFAAMLFGWPIQHKVAAPAVLVPQGFRCVYATVAGTLFDAVRPGIEVEAGETIARLADPEIEQTLLQFHTRCEAIELERRQLLALRWQDPQADRRLPSVEAALADARVQLAEQRRESGRLVLVAPRSGQVMAPADHLRSAGPPVSSGGARLASWTGSPLEERNVGCWIETGTLICSVADPAQLEAWVAVDESEITEIRSGQKVRILLEQHPLRLVEGNVVEVARRSVRNESDWQATDQLQQSPGRSSAPEGQHVVRVRLDVQDAMLLPGSRGRAKIATSSFSLAESAARFLRSRLRLPW